MANSKSADARNRFISSIVGAALAETVSLPTDVAKVRLQVQTAGVGYSGMLDCMSQTYKSEGVNGLFKGLAPALTRQLSYTSIAMTIFEPIRNLVTRDPENPTFFSRLLAGGCAGAIGIAIMNPTEVLKTQIQSCSTSSLSMASVFKTIWRSEGIKGFWAGVQPNVARTFLVNAAELGTYDQAKSEIISRKLLPDGGLAHLAASTIAGVASAITSTPVDVVKTRLMNQAGHGDGQFNGILDCFVKTYKQEGFLALYKGFIPIVVRKVIWCSIFFVTYERLRKLMEQSFSKNAAKRK